MARVPHLLRRMRPALFGRAPALQPEYDYIIVGAGSAGCLLANELSADGSKQVLLLEAGGWDTNPMIHIPAGVYTVFKDPSLNWNMETEPEPECVGRRLELPRGKVVGGSSSINAMVYMRGHPLDYDGWASEFDLPEWSFERCLPYFRRCESSDRGDSAYRGREGRLQVTEGRLANPMFDALLEAASQSGQGRTDDPNGRQPAGIGRYCRTICSDGSRSSAAEAHLQPALGRPNLTLATGELVEKVELEGGRAVGVRLARGGEAELVRAAESVVLSAGSIKSPQCVRQLPPRTASPPLSPNAAAHRLLMLSGIGDESHLAAHGIGCEHHLPGVGANLMDHACFSLGFHCDTAGSLNHLSQPAHKLAAGAAYLLGFGGPVASNIWEAGGVVFGNEHGHLSHPNLQYHFAPILAEDKYDGKDMELKSGMQMQIDQLRPYSRGAITLRSADPADDPVALFNYLQDPRDMAEMVDGYRTGMELLQQPALAEFRGAAAIAARNHPKETDADIEQFVRANSGTDYHPCGTCRMGGAEGDEMAVVDGEMRVRGVGGLYVVDASVMPAIPSGNLNAPTQMIAMRGADFIRGAPQMAAERPGYAHEGG